MTTDNHKDFQRKPLVGMTPYTEGFFSGRRWAHNELTRFGEETIKDLELNNPVFAALLRGFLNDFEEKHK